MEMLDLCNSKDIKDDEAALLLGCLSNVKKMWLLNCCISFEMQTKLYERGREEGCEVIVTSKRRDVDSKTEYCVNSNATK